MFDNILFSKMVQFTLKKKVQFAIDEIFTFSAQLMTGKDLKISTTNTVKNVNFLKSLRICLDCKVGREYLFRHLSQRYCDEMAMFFNLLFKYQNATSAHKRLIIAKNIYRICIDPEGVFAINIAYDTRKKVCHFCVP